jgi:nucleoside-diphosphate-sugar epimerase
VVDDRKALIIGVTGIAGNNLARRLLADGWIVHGVSRRGSPVDAGVRSHAVDVLDAGAVRAALAGVRPTHLFFCTWMRQPTEAENRRVNTAMLRNVLKALEPAGTLRHAALVTGLKHYLGPFEAYGKTPADTPFREDQPRLPVANFYYDQEDVLFEAAARTGMSWSVHRAHTVIGWALGNAMNMGMTLAVYAAICAETGRPFVFPGSPQEYDGITDVTDARLLARQMEWAATAPGAANEAFNITNGDVFRWRRMWRVVAEGLGVPPAEYPGHADPLEPRMGDAQAVWDRIVANHGLRPYRVDQLASFWHTDADLGRPIEAFADMGKSRRFGFLDYQDTSRSFLDLFARLREERIIPPLPAR